METRNSFIDNLGNTEVRAVLFTVLYAPTFCGEACRADAPVSISYKETEAGEERLASKTFKNGMPVRRLQPPVNSHDRLSGHLCPSNPLGVGNRGVPFVLED